MHAVGIAVFKGPSQRDAMKPGSTRPRIPVPFVTSSRLIDALELKCAMSLPYLSI